MKAREYEFSAAYLVTKPTKVSKIVDELEKMGITKKNLFIHNPQLWKIGMNGVVPKGKRLRYRFKNMAFVQAVKIKR